MKTRRWMQRVVVGLLLLTLTILASGCGPEDSYSYSSRGDRVILGGDQVIQSGERIEGDLAVFGGSVVIEEGAEVTGNIAVFGGEVAIEGSVGGDVAVMGGSLTRTQGAVEGEVAVIGGSDKMMEEPLASEPVEPAEPIEPVAPVAPIEPIEPLPPVPPVRPERPQMQAPTVADRIFDAVGYLVRTMVQTIAFGALGLIMTLFLPDHVRRVSQAAGSAPVASIGVGCLTLPATAVLFIVALVTIIGIPIGILLPFVLTGAAVFGWIGLGLYLGDYALRAADIRSPRPAAAAAVGAGGMVLVTSVAGVVPVIGGLLWWMLGFWGLGATILTRGGTQSYPLRPRLKQSVPPISFDPLDDLAPAPRQRSSGNLFDDLAADLGIEKESPVYPPDDKRD